MSTPLFFRGVDLATFAAALVRWLCNLGVLLQS